jgi:hypothetical protein
MKLRTGFCFCKEPSPVRKMLQDTNPESNRKDETERLEGFISFYFCEICKRRLSL